MARPRRCRAFGENPFTIPFAELAHRVLPTGGFWVHELRPGKPPEGKLGGCEGREGGHSSARFSQPLARRRFCPNQEKVRSTTQWREARELVMDKAESIARYLVLQEIGEIGVRVVSNR